MAQKIKLMPDYGCSPLWWVGPGKIGNIDPETLPLSRETINRLNAWADAYDATLDMSDPANSPGFPDEQAEEAFDREGVNLWLQLREELAPDYEVFYYSFEMGKLLAHPGELDPKDLLAAVGG